MNPNAKLAIIAFTIISLAILMIQVNTNDPFYKTNKTISATVVNKYYSTGKMGGSYTMRLKTKSGKIINDSIDPNNDYHEIGDKVTLYIYKRKKSGAIKYLSY